MDTRRYPISSSILQTYTGAGFALIGVSVLSFLITVILVCSATLLSSNSSGSSAPRPSYSRGGSRGAGGGLGLVVIVLGMGMAAGLGAKVPFRRVAEARGTYIELDEEGFLWVQGPRRQVSIPWREVKDVYATDTTLHITGQVKAAVPAEFERFEDLVNQVKTRSNAGS